LPEYPNEDELENIFSKFGKIREMRVPKDRYTNKSKGIAFIKYVDEEGAKDAYRAVTITFQERTLISFR